jgi:riboflavin kinase / FMN adenylyltransferase
MKFLTALPHKPLHHSWITIGSFDGVHLGHQALISRLVTDAHKENHPAVVITFWPHPATFFHRAPQAYALTSPGERTRLIKHLGANEVLTLIFDQELSELNADEFMQKVKDLLDIQQLIVGPNFALGRNRTGTIDQLKRIGKELDFEVVEQKPLLSGEAIISSSQIRKELIACQVRTANQKLGRPFSLEGTVTHGEHRGTNLGIPTANLEISPERLLPGNGVYVTRAVVDGKTYSSVTNIGVNPTFETDLIAPRVEPHLLDMNEQIYGKTLKLEFIEYLRPEIKYETPQALVAQITKDIEKTREILKNES